jgi:DNA gyrase subunit A
MSADNTAATFDLDRTLQNSACASSWDNFIYYASNAIQDKALPHFFDGLVPSQRKLILSLDDLKARPDAKTVKSSSVVSRSTQAYHPVGNTYNVLVNLSQEWRVQAILTAPEGNWGPIESGLAAAERYTEIRFSQFGSDVLFADLPNAERQKSDAVPHGIVPASITYTDLHWEEDYLPARLPLLLLNGQNGIAVGIAQTWQPLAFRPLLTEIRQFLKTGQIDYTKLRPGYPTSPFITSSQQSFIDALKTGRGSVRSTAHHEVVKNRNNLITQIVFTSLPHGVTINPIGDTFNEWRAEDPAECPFKEYRNETTVLNKRDAIKLVFVLREPQPESALPGLLALLFKKTRLSDNHTVNMVALKGRFPVNYTLESFLVDWVEERQQIIYRVAQRKHGELSRQKRRLQILSWVRRNLDPTTAILKSALDEDQLYTALIAMPGLLPELERAELDIVLDLNLRQLSKLAEADLLARMSRLDEQLAEQLKLVVDRQNRIQAIDADLHFDGEILHRAGADVENMGR